MWWLKLNFIKSCIPCLIFMSFSHIFTFELFMVQFSYDTPSAEVAVGIGRFFKVHCLRPKKENCLRQSTLRWFIIYLHIFEMLLDCRVLNLPQCQYMMPNLNYQQQNLANSKGDLEKNAPKQRYLILLKLLGDHISLQWLWFCCWVNFLNDHDPKYNLNSNSHAINQEFSKKIQLW